MIDLGVNLRILFLPVMFLLLVSGGVAQDESIEVDTELVNLSVEVVDRKGKAVTSLSKSDFLLFEDGKPKEIAFFSTQAAPISYGIVYDLHPTTSPQTRSVLRALEVFTNSLGENEDFFLTVFNDYGSLNINFIPTADQIARHLSFGERNEPNSLYDALYFAAEKLKARSNQKKTLIIISDGKDHQSHHSFSELEKLLESFNVQIYAVILDTRDLWDYSDLAGADEPSRLEIDDSELEKAAIRAISSESGGDASSVAARNSIALYKIFERISGEMRGRYSIAFYPAGEGRRQIRLTLKDPSQRNFRLNYKSTYVIPGARQ